MIQSIEEGRKEDGNRSIADKILKRLHDLDKTVSNNQGRWAWELLQNAKDSIANDEDRRVSIQIVLKENSVEFKHDGTHFTEQDVRGLINQISSKEVEDRQQAKKTGRFGTGFLTTHLLSRIIHVKGILETSDNKFYKFEFPLDRQGKNTVELIPKIETAWSEFHKSATEITSDYDKNSFNTSFLYHLTTEEQRRVAKIGIVEFSKLLPFVLTFIRKIKGVQILDKTNKKISNVVFQNDVESDNDKILPISKYENNVLSQILILHAHDDKVAIATEVTKTFEGYFINNIDGLPKLFCDFPLIGTETFHLPVIVNSFYFNPTTERNSIWLKGDNDKEVLENRSLLLNAVELYRKLILHLEQNNYHELYNIAETKLPCVDKSYFDEYWYKEEVQKRIREVVYNVSIVEMETNSLDKKAVKDLNFPLKTYAKKKRDEIGRFYSDVSPNTVCKYSHLHQWCEVLWDDCHTLSYQKLVLKIVEQINIANLNSTLGKDTNFTIDWINDLLKFLLEEDGNLSMFERYAIIPNRNGVFKKRPDLFSDNIRDEKLISILELLGDNWKELLVHNSINVGRYSIKEKKDIASKITELLKNPRRRDENFVEAISLLSEWFDNNKKAGEELFSELYRKRAELFMNIIDDKESLYKIMRSGTELSKLAEIANKTDFLNKIEMTGDLINLLKEFKANDVADLKAMLISAQNAATMISKIQITQDSLVSLGVTSLKELEDALKDKNFGAKFNHTSTPSIEMFIYVQKLISRAKENVIKHLKTLSDYDCSDLTDLAPTVISGVKKNGFLIQLVIRPSDNGEVIIYYSAEKEALDYANAELWIDNNIDEPRRLTLGKILKTTGINRIPVST